jgi:hypothetical protein
MASFSEDDDENSKRDERIELITRAIVIMSDDNGGTTGIRFADQPSLPRNWIDGQRSHRREYE